MTAVPPSSLQKWEYGKDPRHWEYDKDAHTTEDRRLEHEPRTAAGCATKPADVTPRVCAVTCTRRRALFRVCCHMATKTV